MVHRRLATHTRTDAERNICRQHRRGTHGLSAAGIAAAGWVGLVALTLAACGPAASQTAPGNGRRVAGAPRRALTAEEMFDPARHRADDVRAEAEQIIREIAPPAVAPEREAAADTSDTSWVIIDGGYRVQLATSATREAALGAAERARTRFPSDLVYVIFQAPYHKVRVGDFRTRQEAKAKEIEARNKGYRQAFWVPSRVRVMRRPGDRPAGE